MDAKPKDSSTLLKDIIEEIYLLNEKIEKTIEQKAAKKNIQNIDNQ